MAKAKKRKMKKKTKKKNPARKKTMKKKVTKKKAAKKKTTKKKPLKAKKSAKAKTKKKVKKKTVKKKPAKRKAAKKKATKKKPLKAKKPARAKTKKKVKKKTLKKKTTKKKAAKKKATKRIRHKVRAALQIMRGKEFFKDIERKLLNQRAELLKLISKSETSEKDISKLERGGLEDMAATSLEREMTFTLGSRERQEFLMINNALKKISTGNYGKCENCGERINIERLKIVPFAQFCMECKSLMEHETSPERREEPFN